MAEVEFLFDSQGAVVAFRHGLDVFDLDLCWLGWSPYNDGDVFDPAGEYLGTITSAGRLYEIQARRGLRSPCPPAPTINCHPNPPPAAAPVRLAIGMRDIRPRRRIRPHLLAEPCAGDDVSRLDSPAVARDSSASLGEPAEPADEVREAIRAVGDPSGSVGAGSDSPPSIERTARPAQAHGRMRSRRRVGRIG